MSTSPQNDRQQAIRTLRMQLHEDLSRLSLAAPDFFAGYLVMWLVSNLQIEQLEKIVDELDESIVVSGRRVLDRPANRHPR